MGVEALGKPWNKRSMEALERVDVPGFKAQEKFPMVFVLDNIRSMNNVGSAFRTADAFNCLEILLVGITACPPHRDINKTALGAEQTVAWKYFDDAEACLNYIKEKNYTLHLIEQAHGSSSLERQVYPSQEVQAFVFGNEVFGVSEPWLKASASCLEIPQFGTKHSLNVAVTMGVVAWDFISKMLSQKLT